MLLFFLTNFGDNGYERNKFSSVSNLKPFGIFLFIRIESIGYKKKIFPNDDIYLKNFLFLIIKF